MSKLWNGLKNVKKIVFVVLNYSKPILFNICFVQTVKIFLEFLDAL